MPDLHSTEDIFSQCRQPGCEHCAATTCVASLAAVSSFWDPLCLRTLYHIKGSTVTAQDIPTFQDALLMRILSCSTFGPGEGGPLGDHCDLQASLNFSSTFTAVREYPIRVLFKSAEPCGRVVLFSCYLLAVQCCHSSLCVAPFE